MSTTDALHRPAKAFQPGVSQLTANSWSFWANFRAKDSSLSL